MTASTSESQPAPKRRLLWRLLTAIALLVVAEGFSFVVSAFIARHFADRPTPRDLLFETLPYFDAGQYVNDLALLAALLLLLTYALLRARDELPEMIAIFGIMYFLRAVIMTLTPLASAHGNGTYFGVVPLIQNGMFPSGHTAAALLCFLLVDPKRAPWLRRVQLGLALIAWTTLLTSHGHYSIDIVGGLLLAYFVWREWTVGSLFQPLKRLVRAEPL